MKKKITVGNKVLFLLCAMYFITYIDRVNIATAAPFIKEDLGLSTTEMGFILSAFAYPYALLQIFGGWIGDKAGAKKTLTFVGIIWAATTALTGMVTGLVSAILVRIGLGFGEGAAFPTATKAMAQWLPKEKFGFAQGIVHSASRLGNAVAPPVIALLIVAFGWRESFFIMGAISVLWIIAWHWYFKENPKDHPKITQEELEKLPVFEEKSQQSKKVVPWKKLFKRILPVTFVDFCYGWTLWVYLTWLPSFLFTAYNLDIKKSALFAAGILLSGVIGDTLGGVLSDKIYVKTNNLKLARRSILVVGLTGSLIFLLPTLFVHNLTWIAISMSLAFFFLELCNANLWAIPMDIAPNYSGTASGMMNTGFGVAGMISPVAFGFLISFSGNWQVPFIMSVLLLLIGVFVTFTIDPSKKLEVEPDQPGTDISSQI
ncbi:MFS transporter [Neobacillus kokaensis]|uniref:MFS transporter n=1 Tax=Neobacillus kokaensis TaxID=2759023 RepID=A0ABQ3N1U6_9BACI|nr:MFS transporter [Neobacillus kokaensis]GHH98918.1 MFS transporter [Neobacillus kokaensis]